MSPGLIFVQVQATLASGSRCVHQPRLVQRTGFHSSSLHPLALTFLLSLFSIFPEPYGVDIAVPFRAKHSESLTLSTLSLYISAPTAERSLHNQGGEQPGHSPAKCRQLSFLTIENKALDPKRDICRVDLARWLCTQGLWLSLII